MWLCMKKSHGSVVLCCMGLIREMGAGRQVHYLLVVCSVVWCGVVWCGVVWCGVV
jgi:hypothetical protein